MAKLGAAMILSCVLASAAGARLLDPMFADHAVLQRDRPIAVWGEAAPGAKVDVALGPTHVGTMAGADGHWRASLPAIKASGPFSLTASSGSEALTLQDVLVGDVFMCSGQSNMEFPVVATAGGKDTVAASADAGIRLLTIPQLSSATPVVPLAKPAEWKVAGPDSTGDFSAVCFFMAQALRQQHKGVPIGLIDNSWGGSAISAWLKPEAYLATGGDAHIAEMAKLFASDPAAGNRAWGDTWQEWWSAHEKDPAEAKPWAADFVPDASWKPVPAIDHWSTWGVPALNNFVGLMWYRTTVTLTAAQAAQGATLMMGWVDDLDQTWVNGHAVGTGWGAPQRRYPIPVGALHAGANVVVVNDFNTWADGGMLGPGETRAIQFADGSRVPLDGHWLYRAVTEFRDQPPRAPWDAIAGVGTIQNGMVAPIGAYGLKGAAWYQGESDSGSQLRYAPKLKALISQWRSDFGRDLPVAVIQLPNFGPSTTPPVESDWAGLREAQRRAAEGDPRAALVVTIDLGDPANLHPTNKRPVGDRLARAMEHIAYGNPRTPSGPTPLSAKRAGTSILIAFGDVDGRLAAGPVGPFELCGDRPGSCQVVAAKVDGGTVVLPAAAAATRVRYCWADSPTCTLHDTTLPASPFELAIQ
jgi:sialate O-acetylesterase